MNRQPQPTILHHAEEFGQSRAYTKEEPMALLRLALVIGFWAGGVSMLIGAGYLLYNEFGFWTMFFILAFPTGVLVAGGLVLMKGAHEQLDGLRSWRGVTAYAPPQPAQPAPEPHPPFWVRSATGAQLMSPDTPLLEGRKRQRVEITPELVTIVLREIFERHAGQWSRARIMGIKYEGRNLPRRIYETLTDVFCKTNLLTENPQGGYQFPFENLDEMMAYLPGLEAGGQAGRSDGGNGYAENDPSDLPAGGTLAEQHRWARLGELDHSVRNYLEGDGDGP